MAKWQSYKRFRIVDTVRREYVDTIDATNGKVAMQKFRRRIGIKEIAEVFGISQNLEDYGRNQR